MKSKFEVAGLEGNSFSISVAAINMRNFKIFYVKGGGEEESIVLHMAWLKHFEELGNGIPCSVLKRLLNLLFKSFAFHLEGRRLLIFVSCY